MQLVNAEQMQAADRLMEEKYHYPVLLLMETAGRLSAEFLQKTYPEIGQFLILVGPGNNGGDGLVAARYLHMAGKEVWVVLATEIKENALHAQTNLGIVRQAHIRVSTFGPDILQEVNTFIRRGAVIVDALLGTGVKTKLQKSIGSVVDYFRERNQTVVALDMPSGLQAETGHVLSTPIKADYTLAFQLPKFCHYVTPASNYCGVVRVIPVGIYPEVLSGLAPASTLVTDQLVRDWHRQREPDAHKGSYGHVLLAGGSRGKAGAIALATQASLEIGAGLATAFIPASISCAFHRTNLENMSIPYGTDTIPHLNETSAEVLLSFLGDKSALAIGPGLSNNDDTVKFLTGVLGHISLPLVLDADALNILADNPELWAGVPEGSVLTPHPGEMARLLQIETTQVQARRLECATELAVKHRVIIVLKGAGTITATPDGAVYVNPTGNPGMATAGTGDVLTGTIAGIIAQNYTPLQAAVMAVYLHGKAGDRVARTHGQEGVVASRLMRALSPTLKDILSKEKGS